MVRGENMPEGCDSISAYKPYFPHPFEQNPDEFILH
jgi:hypothetical protein